MWSYSLQKFFPFESKFIDVAGFRCHYIDEGGVKGGNKPVVLLIHGNPTWVFYYRNLIAALKPNFRVIAVDHIGCGLSEHPAGRTFRARDRINHLSEFIKKLGITRYSLVMHDWGGPIGTGVAVENPEQIERLVYLNTTLTETESLPFSIKLANSRFIGKFLTKTTKRFLKLTTGLGAAVKIPRNIKQGYYYPYPHASDRQSIWDFVDDIPFDTDHPSYTEMLKIAEGLKAMQHIPVQVIWGLKDPCFHREMLTNVVKHFPLARVLEIPEASHLVLEDAPEQVCSTIHAFLSSDHEDLSRPGGGEGEGDGSVLNRALSEIAKQAPYQAAAIVPRFVGRWGSYEHINYNDIVDLVNRYQRGLSAFGLTPGDRVLMLVPPGIDFLALSYAVMAQGAVPIFIDPGIDRRYLFQCLADIKADVFIGSQKAHLLRYIKPGLFRDLKFYVIANDFSISRGPNLRVLRKYSSSPPLAKKRSSVAMIAFTSGATGKPKGVVFTQEMVAAQLSILRDTFGLLPGNRDLPLLPIFSLFNLALGVGSVFPAIDPARPLSLDPSRIVRIIFDLNVQFSFGSPTLWRKIAEYCFRTKTALTPMKRIFMAGAPVPQQTAELVQSILDTGEAFTPYGATEALPITCMSVREVIGRSSIPANSGEVGTRVGKPLPGITVRIVEASDDPMSTIAAARELGVLEIGEVIVSGANISSSYMDREDANKLNKIVDGEKVWHRMGDMGYLDSEGNLYFCGRKAHRVWGGERIYYSVPTERIFNQHPKVNRAALVDAGLQTPAIVIEPAPQSWPNSVEEERRFEQELKDLAQSTPLTSKIEKIMFHRSFPVDRRHNAKIFRDRLGQWAREKLERSR